MIKYKFFILVLAATCFSALSAWAQDSKNYEKRDFCSQNNWSNDRSFSARDLRETTVAASSLLNVDADRNGGVRVIGENRSDVLVRACVQAWANSDNEAQSRVKNIRVETTGGNVRSVNSAGGDDWSVSYEIHVPQRTNLKLTAYNGGIGISGVDGTLDFQTQNGGVSLSDVAGNVRGRTQNGGVSVKLSGARWNGTGLNVETQNGGVTLEMPQNYAARLETATVNGGFRSDFEISVKMRDWNRGVNISTDLNGGGAPVRVVTTNGGVRIRAVN